MSKKLTEEAIEKLENEIEKLENEIEKLESETEILIGFVLAILYFFLIATVGYFMVYLVCLLAY